MKGTIPLPIVEALMLEHGDEIDWQLEARNGKIVAVVKKGGVSDSPVLRSSRQPKGRPIQRICLQGTA